jgi:hypothetical protein
MISFSFLFKTLEIVSGYSLHFVLQNITDFQKIFCNWRHLFNQTQCNISIKDIKVTQFDQSVNSYNCKIFDIFNSN